MEGYSLAFNNHLPFFPVVFLQIISKRSGAGRKGAVYKEIITAYVIDAKARGFTQAVLWASSPRKGVNFIFNQRPASQAILTQEKLVDW